MAVIAAPMCGCGRPAERLVVRSGCGVESLGPPGVALRISCAGIFEREGEKSERERESESESERERERERELHIT